MSAESTPSTAGGMLRAAREASGMTLDAVAQQLKLAPRQVTAIEDGDYASLPGRTFVRGFMRNYARLVHLDPDRVLAALATGDAPEPDSPALHPTAPTMGELPTTDHGKSGLARWAIPLTLVAVIAAAAIYELTRGPADLRHPTAAEPERSAASAPAPASPQAPPAAATPPAPTTTPLTNPLAAQAPAEPAAAPPAGPGAEAAAPGAHDAALVLTFRDSSWVEVKDADGRLLLSQRVPAGQTRSLAGAPPFDVVIGNASEVSVSFRGQPIDLAPFTRQNVARMQLQ